MLEWAGAGRAALGALLPDLADATDGSESIRLQLFEAITMLWERATALGGAFAAGPTPEGWRASCHVPLNAEDASPAGDEHRR